jgi:EAL domain-containing protein (putative c-di-GMP-specific phosphodiesterase class I)/ActR/RegA family two-component response regulator
MLDTQDQDVLIILDEDPQAGQTMALVARMSNCAARVSADADEFLQWVRTSKPQHVLVDLALHEPDCLKILRAMAQDAYKGNVIVASTLDTRTLDAAARAARSLGLRVAGVLAKPFSVDRLRELLITPISDTTSTEGPEVPVSHEILMQAMENSWIEPYFQPKVDCQTGQFWGVEALARMHHPTLGVVAPDGFIRLAEQHGLIDPLTLCILDKSLQWLTQCPMPDCHLAVNISRTSTDCGFARELMNLCRQYEIDPQRITLEVTETAQAKDDLQLLEFLTRFRIQGFHLSLDDFGVGYSSLLELARLPFSEIKIDRRFVSGLEQSSESQKICSAIVGLGKALGLEVTAEGIEDESAMSFLSSIGCDKAQGYLMGQPMRSEEALAWVRRQAVA